MDFSTNKTWVMGILNVTPDSFSGDGFWKTNDPIETAIIQAKQFIQQGVDILDIGAESTRPGADKVDEQEEIKRAIPIIKAVRLEFPTVVISIDTYKAHVAEQAIVNGANWINDVWGFKADPEMAAIAAKYNVPCILMHNRSKTNNAQILKNLGGRYVGMHYQDFIEDIKRELIESVKIGLQAGVRSENIILDPGIGFGKTVEQNLYLLNHLDAIKSLGFPILLGPSRKSFIGYTLNLPPHDRLEGTLATIAVGILRGADIIRVHDVQAGVRVAAMVNAIRNSQIG
jgi:dihydropteroate synthase